MVGTTQPCVIFPCMVEDIAHLITRAMLRDQSGFVRALGEAVQAAGRAEQGARQFVGEPELRRQIEESVARREVRLKARPQIWFPEELPVSGKREELRTVIEHNQVVVVCGETGSGKTTQLPKICSEIWAGVAGMIGHTQPGGRIAARSVAGKNCG